MARTEADISNTEWYIEKEPTQILTIPISHLAQTKTELSKKNGPIVLQIGPLHRGPPTLTNYAQYHPIANLVETKTELSNNLGLQSNPLALHNGP